MIILLTVGMLETILWCAHLKLLFSLQAILVGLRLFNFIILCTLNLICSSLSNVLIATAIAHSLYICVIDQA